MSQACPYCGEDIKESAVKCRSCGEWLDALAARPDSLACPWCGKAEANREQREQACTACGKAYVLYLGPRVEGTLLPSDHGKTIVSKSAGLFLRMQAEVNLDGFAFGDLDPITGMVPMNSQRVPYGDVVTLATWRKLDWRTLVAATIVLTPITLLALAGTIKAAPLAFLSVPLCLLTAFSFYRAIGIGAHFMRVSGMEETLEFRYDSPIWRRKRFMREALKRLGVEATVA